MKSSFVPPTTSLQPYPIYEGPGTCNLGPVIDEAQSMGKGNTSRRSIISQTRMAGSQELTFWMAPLVCLCTGTQPDFVRPGPADGEGMCPTFIVGPSTVQIQVQLPAAIQRCTLNYYRSAGPTRRLSSHPGPIGEVSIISWAERVERGHPHPFLYARLPLPTRQPMDKIPSLEIQCIRQ